MYLTLSLVSEEALFLQLSPISAPPLLSLPPDSRLPMIASVPPVLSQPAPSIHRVHHLIKIAPSPRRPLLISVVVIFATLPATIGHKKALSSLTALHFPPWRSQSSCHFHKLFISRSLWRVRWGSNPRPLPIEPLRTLLMSRGGPVQTHQLNPVSRYRSCVHQGRSSR